MKEKQRSGGKVRLRYIGTSLFSIFYMKKET